MIRLVVLVFALVTGVFSCSCMEYGIDTLITKLPQVYQPIYIQADVQLQTMNVERHCTDRLQPIEDIVCNMHKLRESWIT